MSPSHLDEALREYPCGPGGHRASYGMGLSQLSSPTCAVCFKRMSEADCLFCAAPAEGARCTVTGPARNAVGRLCRPCRDALTTNSNWTLAAEAPD